CRSSRVLILGVSGVALRRRDFGQRTSFVFSVLPQPQFLPLLVARRFSLAFRSDCLLQTQNRVAVVKSRDHRSLSDEIAYIYRRGDDPALGFCPNIGDFVGAPPALGPCR